MLLNLLADRLNCYSRPTHLPPKNKLEDVKHMKDWEEMMEKSRMAGTSRVLSRFLFLAKAAARRASKEAGDGATTVGTRTRRRRLDPYLETGDCAQLARSGTETSLESHVVEGHSY